MHRIDAQVPADDRFGLLADLVAEGKVARVGLSQVTVADLEAARDVVPIVSVQNLFNLTDHSSDEVLAHCEAGGIGCIPWFPVASSASSGPDTPMSAIVTETRATPTQVALAWLLHRSPVMLPIPGTKSVAHVEENCEAAALRLSEAEVADLDAAQLNS